MAPNLNGIWDYVPITRAEIRAIVKDEIRKALPKAIEAATRERFNDIDSHFMTVEESVTILGEKVSAVDDVLAQLNDATNALAVRLQALVDEVAGGDSATAAKFAPLLADLQALAVDPNNPVPAPTPDDGS